MRKIVFLFFIFMISENFIFASDIDEFLLNLKINNELLSLPELYKKNVDSTVWIRSYYDSSLDKDVDYISRLIFGDTYELRSSGTGFIYSSDGYIVTNYHVIEEENVFEIQYYDGSSSFADVIGYNKDLDIAVLKVDKEKLPYVTFEEDVQIGQWIFVLGNPLSLDFSLSVGVVGGKNREIGIPGKYTQLDINTNPGSSGGPVLNFNGKVIGMVCLSFCYNYGSGIAFIIPQDIIQNVASSIIYDYEMKKKYLDNRKKNKGKMFSYIKKSMNF